MFKKVIPSKNQYLMKTFLISCCDRKVQPVPNLLNKDITTLSFNDEFKGIRKKILEAYNNNRINHTHSEYVAIDWNKTAPAYQVYDGNLYSQVSLENWQGYMVDGKVEYEIMIFSPLFGWIKHTDYIPNYGLSMKDKVTININGKEPMTVPLWELWRNYCLYGKAPNINQHFQNNETYDLLSWAGNHSYRSAWGASRNRANNFNPIGNQNFDDELQDLGIGTDAIRGMILNREINTIRKIDN